MPSAQKMVKRTLRLQQYKKYLTHVKIYKIWKYQIQLSVGIHYGRWANLIVTTFTRSFIVKTIHLFSQNSQKLNTLSQFNCNNFCKKFYCKNNSLAFKSTKKKIQNSRETALNFQIFCEINSPHFYANSKSQEVIGFWRNV